MGLQFIQKSFVIKLFTAASVLLLLVSCRGESSSNNSDRDEVIEGGVDNSINVDSQEELVALLEEQDRESTTTFNLIDSDGNTVSCDSSEVTFDDNNFPSCPNSE